MGYAVTMFFDIETEDKIKKLWAFLSEKKLSSYMHDNKGRPHISLSVYDNLDVPAAQKKLSKFCKRHKSFNLLLSFPGSFISEENVLFIAPVVNKNLLKIHSDYFKVFHGGTNKKAFSGNSFSQINKPSDYYLPDRWQPHCTVTLETPEELYIETFNQIRKNFAPFEASVESVGIAEFKPIKILSEFKLGR